MPSAYPPELGGVNLDISSNEGSSDSN